MTTGKRGRKSNLTPGTAEILKTMIDQGVSQADMAVALKRDKSTISRWVAEVLRNPDAGISSLQAMMEEMKPTPEELEDFRAHVNAHYDENSPTGWDSW